MPASQHRRIRCQHRRIRLPEAELRRFKSLAVNRGVRLQDAVREALQIWAATPPRRGHAALAGLEGSLADVDVEALQREDRAAELERDRRWR